MPLPDERTMTFDLWPNMLMIEGAARDIGSLIESLYEDPAVPRDGWNVAHSMGSRKAYAESLKQSGDDRRRQGFGIRPDKLVPIIESRAKSLGLMYFHLSSKSSAAF
jgi:hypothetical protein